MTKPVLQYRVTTPLAQAEAALRQALQEEGFGILTEVDVAAVLRARARHRNASAQAAGRLQPSNRPRQPRGRADVGGVPAVRNLPCAKAPTPTRR